MLSETTEGDSLLGRGRVLFSKARKLCRESIDSCSLPQDIEALQSVIEELKEVSELLAIEDVSPVSKHWWLSLDLYLRLGSGKRVLCLNKQYKVIERRPDSSVNRRNTHTKSQMFEEKN